MSLRILHLTVARELTPGQLSQLRYEVRASQELEDVEWNTLVYHTASPCDHFVHRLPWLFRSVLLRKLFAWLWMKRHAHNYDFILCRHMTFDPFAFFFAWLIPNRVTVHHAKETEELRLIRQNWQGKAASILERWSGRIAVRTSAAILGVTSEIRDHELALHGKGKYIPASIYPNGILVDEVELLGNKISEKHLDIAFICGTFSSWHGLDILINQLLKYNVEDFQGSPITLHLIGRISPEQSKQVEIINNKNGSCRIEAHGLLTPDRYRKILSSCQAGLSSLALHRKGMTEASTLKVREMLALGLPVYSGHRDTALEESFPWYCIGDGSISDISHFVKKVSSTPRQTIRDDATPFIDKKAWMNDVARFLCHVKTKCTHGR
ncbi:glycosyltransferase [Halorhodospira neutriphila]|uniref:glycosyltransferase n=1 Tax=Halorhodospira neutriphila TaxID=168379 RepID=UPI00190901F0|nr:glycosyltransferase [Halorhodospira neutriphila]